MLMYTDEAPSPAADNVAGGRGPGARGNYRDLTICDLGSGSVDNATEFPKGMSDVSAFRRPGIGACVSTGCTAKSEAAAGSSDWHDL